MPKEILADTAVSISELKENPHAAAMSGDGFPVAVLNRNEPDFYGVPAQAWEALMDKLEDQELNAFADQRADEESVEVRLDAL
ncbi:type II toxin-antitoxin system Phd/YefM family antitoxin [Endothiovibrio diazotrophicus]